MNKLKRSFSLRSSKRHIPESVRPHVWENDSYKVRNGGVSFPVKYVGFVEVTESRGTQVCAEAFRRMKETGTGKKKRMQLLVTADCVRVVDEETKSLVIDQTIEKVSFCTPDPSNDRVFSYICRDGTTRRWMCHCFIAIRDTGERLSHAVGCAFTACLQRKQKAQALQQQQKEGQLQPAPGQQLQQQQQPQQPPEGTVTASTTPVVNGTSVPTQPQPQPSPAPVVNSAPIPASVPVAAAVVSSSAVPTPAPVQNGTIPSTTQQPSKPAQLNQPTAPPLKPPPTVARPRPQPFSPSPFTRHMSLRYRSNPLSFMPLRGDSTGYETLTEEPSAPPQLPTPTETLMLPNNSSLVSQPSVPLNNAPSQAGNIFNGYGTSTSSNTPASDTLLSQSRVASAPNNAAPFPPFAVQSPPAQVSGGSPWGVSTQQQQQAAQQRQRNLSDAEMWLATATADTTVPPGKTMQSNQGLLTTVNPFAETASQIGALSSAWTQDLQVNLPNTTSQAAASSSPWAASSGHVSNGEDEFASFFAARQTSPPAVSKQDSANPFSPSSQEQVFWV